MTYILNKKTPSKNYKAKIITVVPTVSLSAHDKKKIVKILAKDDIVITKTKDERNDIDILSVKDMSQEELIKYENCDHSYYTITLNGNIVADVDWTPSVNLSPKAQRIFDTISLIEKRHTELLAR